MKRTTMLLRRILLVAGIILFAFATAGEFIHRSNWEAISPHVDVLAKQKGFKSYDSIEDEDARDQIYKAALLLAAQDSVAQSHGFRNFSKVKDKLKVEKIKAEALDLVASKPKDGFGIRLGAAWIPLLIISLLILGAAITMIVLDRRKSHKFHTIEQHKPSLIGNLFSDQRVLLVLVILLLSTIVGLINPKFLRLTNIIAIFQQVSVLGVLTMTQAMLLISGGIDLSIGNMMSLVGVMMATMLMAGHSLFVTLLAALLLGIACGFFNGIIISKSRCIPLIITLGTGQIFYGIGLLICGGSFLQFRDKLEFLRKIQLYNFLPLMVLFMLAIVFITYFLLNKTKFGRRIVAIGGNEKNAYLSGINIDLYKTITYTIGGMFVSIAALIISGRMNAITATAGQGYETDSLVAAIIGGVTFEGGRGTVLGAFLGCLLTGIISNALDILGAHAYVKIIISGAIIVAAVVLSNINNLRKKK